MEVEQGSPGCRPLAVGNGASVGAALPGQGCGGRRWVVGVPNGQGRPGHVEGERWRGLGWCDNAGHAVVVVVEGPVAKADVAAVFR